MKRRCVIIIAYFLIFSSFLTSAQGETGATGKGSFTDLTKFGIEDLMKIEVATVVSASKYKQKVTEAPSSVSIITSDEIKQYGYRTLADILRSLRGFFVTSDRNYNYIGARGFSRPGDYNTRFLILLDGHRLNDNIYDQAYIGTEFIIDVDLIDRVEIIRGPSSSLYGTNAFFGVINVITKERCKRTGDLGRSGKSRNV
jgi:outer membrane receptor for ferrienterochelin and colicins